MKLCQCNYIFMVFICILFISLIGVTGCTNNESANVIPTFEEPKLPPREVTIGQIYDDYSTDPIAADDKYKGKRLCFYEVMVEEVDGSNTKKYFITGNVKFILRSNSMMQNVKQGYVLNLIGECQGLLGMSRKIITISDCWAGSVIGDLGTDEWVDTY